MAKTKAETTQLNGASERCSVNVKPTVLLNLSVLYKQKYRFALSKLDWPAFERHPFNLFYFCTICSDFGMQLSLTSEITEEHQTPRVLPESESSPHNEGKPFRNVNNH